MGGQQNFGTAQPIGGMGGMGGMNMYDPDYVI